MTHSILSHDNQLCVTGVEGLRLHIICSCRVLVLHLFMALFGLGLAFLQLIRVIYKKMLFNFLTHQAIYELITLF